eukprot:GEMP01026051.1.p1 GENE.GEMP01026051.1~~GEMP01026051.1.p1  ORF type:complete len:299 (+),score=56.22 GEMP01026051.1:68-964(+)
MDKSLLNLAVETHGLLLTEAAAQDFTYSSLRRMVVKSQREVDALTLRNSQLQEALEDRDREIRRLSSVVEGKPTEENYRERLRRQEAKYEERLRETRLDLHSANARLAEAGENERKKTRKILTSQVVSFDTNPTIVDAAMVPYPDSVEVESESESPSMAPPSLSRARISSFFPASDVTDIVVSAVANDGRFFSGDVGGDAALTRFVQHYRKGRKINSAVAKIWRQGASGCWADLTEVFGFEVGDKLRVSPAGYIAKLHAEGEEGDEDEPSNAEGDRVAGDGPSSNSKKGLREARASSN